MGKVNAIAVLQPHHDLTSLLVSSHSALLSLALLSSTRAQNKATYPPHILLCTYLTIAYNTSTVTLNRWMFSL